ncbi:hypothetical protein Hanom_Chr16g01449711 [Helianthus anomalus]
MESQPVGEGSGNSFSKDDSGKGGGSYDRSAEGVLHDHEKGSPSKVVGDKAGEIFFFKSKKRSRRYRKKAGRAHSRDPFNCHGEFMDSCEKNRPTKRNRAQFSNSDEDRFSNRAQEAVNSDLFSLNRLLVQTSREKEKDGGGETQEEVRPASGFTPLPTSDFRFDLNNIADSSSSGGESTPKSAEELKEGDGVMADMFEVDREVEATINLGTQLGMKLGDCGGVVKKVILCKGINDVLP